MQLSERTIEILKNFATINPSIVIQQGNLVRQVSPSKTILSHALVEENFPNKFGIYDLNRFLGTLSLFTKPDLFFTDYYVAIKSGSQQSKFFYCEPEQIMTPPDNELPVDNVIAEFTLTEHDLAAIMKGANVLQAPEFVIEHRAGDIVITAKDSKNTASNTFERKVGEALESPVEFSAIIKVEHVKLAPGSYDVRLSSSGLVHFKQTSGSLQYWIVTENSSKYQ